MQHKIQKMYVGGTYKKKLEYEMLIKNVIDTLNIIGKKQQKLKKIKKINENLKEIPNF